jgi:hypothetical protein
VKSDLKWKTDLHYDTSGNVRPWIDDQNRSMDMTEPLRQTMAKNPFLKVFTQRIAFGYYEAGYMIYIRPSAHKLKTAVAMFLTSNAGTAARSTTTPQP